jgi:hypothetical protein
MEDALRAPTPTGSGDHTLTASGDIQYGLWSLMALERTKEQYRVDSKLGKCAVKGR